MHMNLWYLLVPTVSLLFPAIVYAQGKPMACQYIESGGLAWDNGRWTISRFVTREKFILVIENQTITKSSASKPMAGPPEFITCNKVDPLTNINICFDEMGAYLIFRNLSMTGAVAQILGGTSSRNTRDNLSVSPFSCQPF
jgi:hypothetical protein